MDVLDCCEYFDRLQRGYVGLTQYSSGRYEENSLSDEQDDGYTDHERDLEYLDSMIDIE